MKIRLSLPEDSIFEEILILPKPTKPVSKTYPRPRGQDEWRETFFDWQLTDTIDENSILVPSEGVTADPYTCTARILKKLRYRMAQDMNAGEMTNSFAMESSTALIEYLILNVPGNQFKSADAYVTVCTVLRWLAEELTHKDGGASFKKLHKSTTSIAKQRLGLIYTARHFVGAARSYIGAM